MTKVRKVGGQLVETELQGTGLPASGTPGAAPTPVTPAGSAAAGANPDQAKMAGTPAQVKPVLAEAVAPAQTLQTAQRAQAGQPQADPSAYQQAQDKLGTLKGYGSYADRLQAIIQSRLQGVATAATSAKVSEAGLKAYDADPTKKAAVKSAVEAYLANPTEAGLQALATAVAGPNGDVAAALTFLKTPGLGGLLEGSTETLAAFGKGLAKVTVAEMAAARPGWDLPTMAADLGVDLEELKGWSPDQLQAKIQAKVGTEFSQVEALQAELASASPQRAQQIQAELARLGVQGTAATEQQARALADSLEAQEEIVVNGQSVNIQTLLADDKVSDMIRDALGNPAALQALKDDPVTAALGAWVETHKASLDQVIGDAAVQATSMGAAQTALGAKFKDIPPALLKQLGYDPTAVLTTEQIAELTTKIETSPLVQALTTNPELASSYEANPKLMTALLTAGAAAADIPKLIEANTALSAIPPENKQWLKAFGIDLSGPITDPAVAGRAQATWAMLSKAGPAGATVMNDPDLWEDVRPILGKDKNGNLMYGPPTGKRKPTALAQLLSNPDILKDALAAATALTGADEELKLLFGRSSWKPTPGKIGAFQRDVAKMQGMVDAYNSPNASAVRTTDPDTFKALVQAGVLDTTAELRNLTPAKLAAAAAAHADRSLMSQLAKDIRTKSPTNAFASVAKLVMGHAATGEEFQTLLDRARTALGGTPTQRSAARDFFKSINMLDTDGDGVVTRNDILQTNQVEGDYGIAPGLGAAMTKWAATGNDALNGKPSPFAAIRKSLDAMNRDDPFGTVYDKNEADKARKAGEKVESTEWVLKDTHNRWRTGNYGETIEWTENVYHAVEHLVNGKTRNTGKTRTEKVNERVTKSPTKAPRAAGEVGADSGSSTNDMSEG